ncbi:MAG: transporter substrate-binding domain-containing protein [Geminicoccaceae bacterium]
MRLDRRAALGGLAALAAPIPAAARIYADTVSTVGESLDEIRAKGRLRVGVYADFAPFSTASSNGPQGVDVEIARLVADRLGIPLELVVVQAGDSVDDDLRNHVWRGTVVGHEVVNLLLHVPYNRQLATRSELAVLVQPYFTETLAIVRDPRQVPEDGEPDLAALEGMRIGVELDSLPDFYLGSTLGGRLRDSVVHYRRPEEALAALLSGEIAAFMGLRSQIDFGLGKQAERFDLDPIPLPGLRLTSWAVGAAVRENARDLGYAAGDVLATAVRDGTIRAIFAADGLDYQPPPFS